MGSVFEKGRAGRHWTISAAVFFQLLGPVSEASTAAGVWPIERSWDAQEEGRFSDWVAGFGDRSWPSVTAMLHSPENSLATPSDRGLRFYSDCADFPYILRAYYAYKRRLPFLFNRVGGGRYSKIPNRTVATEDNLSAGVGVQRFFDRIVQGVHSGNFRTAPSATDSFCYPVAIRREFVRPGAVFYNPNGHVAVVCEVTGDGVVRMLDAHPDQSISRIVLGPKMEWRGGGGSGGFKWYRPCFQEGMGVQFPAGNRSLPGFSVEQSAFGDAYYLTVRRRLATRRIDVVRDFEHYIREDIFAEVLARVGAVERGWHAGGSRAIPLPSNIYSAEGDWENYSTPGRDIRLRTSFLGIEEKVRGYRMLWRSAPEEIEATFRNENELVGRLIKVKERLFAELQFTYQNSGGMGVTLDLSDLEQRLFRLSFDPNHAPELRWGAVGQEGATARRDNPRYYRGYNEQQPWRNRLATKSGAMTVHDADNPPNPPRHDITQLMAEQVRGH